METPETSEAAYKKIEAILEHIQNVQRNCYRLGLKMIKRGEVEFGRALIAHGQIHDNSKLTGIEFKHLFHGDSLLGNTIEHHRSVNPHHAEYWEKIHNMPDIYLAEMVCDCAARSAEFGTDIRKWITEEATKRYKFSIEDRVGITMMKYLDELLSPSFT